MSPLLQLHAVEKGFGGSPVLRGINLALNGDSYISLLGPSGSGKTTLLRVIAGFDEPDRGDVILDGKRVDDVPTYQRNIGFVFQNFALFPHLSVARNIGFGLENRAIGAMPADERRDRVAAMIELVGLTGLEDRGIAQISGGQRQRVALARTLVTEPKLVLLDEPLGALDANLRTRMRDELRAIRERLGVTFLHVTGSETEALAMGDTVIVLANGRIAQSDLPDTIYSQPASAEIARFLNCYNIFSGVRDGGEFVGPAGRFAIASASVRSVDTAPAYAIRQDKIAVKPHGAGAGDGEESVGGTFIASEYSGAAVLSFFALDDGRVIEVEDHLSLREAPAYAEKQRYSLTWQTRDALVFA
jgi:ABC-type Fe3+/spermidine/putrescine transport system ATPase subunit